MVLNKCEFICKESPGRYLLGQSISALAIVEILPISLQPTVVGPIVWLSPSLLGQCLSRQCDLSWYDR